MVVLDYELNLSKTEFLYYLQCPQKFRIHRILNPVPYKSAFMSKKRRTVSSYLLREYEGKSMEGIITHSFFETFHRRYYNKILDEPPEEITGNPIKLLFWQYQLKKFHQDPDYWMPFRTELRLMTERQRGIIDCLEMCPNEKEVRIIDFKALPHENDKLSLVFYANLFKEFRIENKELDLFPFEVAEIGCYYYERGVERIFTLEQKEIEEFQVLLHLIIKEISSEKFNLDSNCYKCLFFDICKCERT